MNYLSDFDLDLKHGQIYEEKLRGLLTEGGRIEVKTDKIGHVTKNFAVEIQSRNKPSGISVTKSDYWACWYEKLDLCILVSTKRLKTLLKNKPIKSGGDNNTSQLVLIPIMDLFNYKKIN